MNGELGPHVPEPDQPPAQPADSEDEYRYPDGSRKLLGDPAIDALFNQAFQEIDRRHADDPPMDARKLLDEIYERHPEVRPQEEQGGE